MITSQPYAATALANLTLTEARTMKRQITSLLTLLALSTLSLARPCAAQVVKFMDAPNAEGGCVTDFDRVGFSMGGLVARSMVLKFPGALVRCRVANPVAMGTPNHGVNPIVTSAGTASNVLLFGRSGTATAQMTPFSLFLIDLNARRIPPSIKVTTIAGSGLVDTGPQPPHPQGDTKNVACTHLVARHPDGDQLPEIRVPCAHPECKRRIGSARVQFGPQHPDGDVVGGGRVACTHRVQQHPGGDAVTTACMHPLASRRERLSAGTGARCRAADNRRRRQVASLLHGRTREGHSSLDSKLQVSVRYAASRHAGTPGA